MKDKDCVWGFIIGILLYLGWCFVIHPFQRTKQVKDSGKPISINWDTMSPGKYYGSFSSVLGDTSFNGAGNFGTVTIGGEKNILTSDSSSRCYDINGQEIK